MKFAENNDLNWTVRQEPVQTQSGIIIPGQMAIVRDDGETEFAFAILADGISPTLGARNRARASMDRLLGVIVKGNH